MKSRHLALSLSAALALAASGVAFAQTPLERRAAERQQEASLQRTASAQAAQPAPPPIAWDERRLERLERNVRRLERAIQQAAGADRIPPELTEPDPEMVALRESMDLQNGKVADLEAALQRLNGQLETLTYELQQSRRAQTAAETANRQLVERVTALETRLAEQQAAAAAEQAAQPTVSGDAAADFAAAKKLMLDGEFEAASRALDAFIQGYPGDRNLPEANYLLAETRFVRDDHQGAAASYATALRGWPTQRWAPDGTVKLATSLLNLNRNPQACAALAEFDRRYAATAAASVKTRATALRQRARCS